MVRIAWLVVVVSGCAEPAAPSFTYHATATWYVGTVPQVIAVTVDGQPLASGAAYELTERFASYDAAVADFVAREVVVTTSSGAQTFTIAPGQCTNAALQLDGAPLISEHDDYSAMPGDPDRSVVGFYAYCGECSTRSRTAAWCARAAPRL